MTVDTDDPDWNEIVREASAARRGYADYWEWSIDRTLAEEHAARVLVHFLTKRDELVSGVLESWKPDPPDMLLTGDDGSRVGTDVTEFVNSEMVKRTKHLKKQGLPVSYEWAPWTSASIATELSRIIAVKDFKLKKANGQFGKFLLAIVTDEPIIDEVIGRQAVIQSRAVAELIDRAFLILSYHPQADEGQFPDRCPVLEVPLHRQL